MGNEQIQISYTDAVFIVAYGVLPKNKVSPEDPGVQYAWALWLLEIYDRKYKGEIGV